MSSAGALPFARGAVPLPTGRESAAFDDLSIRQRGVPEAALMETAGRQAAALVQRLYPTGEVVGLVGAGNNGGDALVALRTLAAWGRPVRAVLCADRPVDDPLLHGWTLEVCGDTELDDDALTDVLRHAAVVVDGVLGTGIRGAPRARQARAIVAVGRAARPVVALDVPSGIDADTGAVDGEAIRADLTVAFGWPKLGSLLHPARAHTGRLVAVEIGFPPPGPERWPARLLTPGWARPLLPVRASDTHKNAVGALLVVAGREGMAGAAVLAARAGLRAGAGFVRIASAPANREILQEAVPDAPFVDVSDDAALTAALDASRAVAAGPGLGTGDEAEQTLRRVLEGGHDLVLDADALNLLAQGRPTRLARAAVGRSLVVTPHPGEMSRLMDLAVSDLQGRRPAVARALADEAGCVVLLKGSPTLVAEPGGALGVSGVGGSELAAAGMGDVLTGTVGSFLAQGVAAPDAAGLALMVTGAAAARTGLGAGLAASDVPDELAGALAAMGPGESELDEPWVILDLGPAR